MVYIVTYDLRDPGADYDGVIKAISQYPRNMRIQKSVWLIVTSNTHIQVRDFLQRFIDGNDRLFVGRLNKGSAWYNLPPGAGDWIRGLPDADY